MAGGSDRDGPSVRGPLASALSAVLSGETPPAHDDVASWWAAQRERSAAAGDPWEAAVRGGAMADRVGWAFAAGYEAALSALLPDRDRTRAAALCATEIGGVHPQAIATELRDGALYGEKTFVTLGAEADELLVLAKVGEGPDGRARLVLASCAAGAAGVTMTPLAQAPFVPEIPHASARFDGAPAAALPGDGWADYVRPFRTVEDAHVHAAFVAWLTASARRWGWPPEHLERGLAILAALGSVAAADPSTPAVHLALAGVLAETRAWLEALEPCWASAPEADRARWRRDRPLLDVASKARERRRQRAWEGI